MLDEADPGLAALFLCPLSDASSSGSLSVRELRRLGPFAFSVVALVSLEKEEVSNGVKKLMETFTEYGKFAVIQSVCMLYTLKFSLGLEINCSQWS